MNDHHFSYILRLKLKKTPTPQLVPTEIITLTPALAGNLIFLINHQFQSLFDFSDSENHCFQVLWLKKKSKLKKTTGSGYLLEEEEESNYQQKEPPVPLTSQTFKEPLGFTKTVAKNQWFSGAVIWVFPWKLRTVV